MQPLHVEGTCQLVLFIGQHTLGIHLFGNVQLDHTRVGGAQGKATVRALPGVPSGKEQPGSCRAFPATVSTCDNLIWLPLARSLGSHLSDNGDPLRDYLLPLAVIHGLVTVSSD